MIERLCWALVAMVHVGPAIALFSPSLLGRLYGVFPGDPAFLLLQHRAALFLGIVIMCAWAAGDPGVRKLAAVVAATSMASFLLLYWQADAPPALRMIAIADLVGLVPLAYAAVRAFARSPG